MTDLMFLVSQPRAGSTLLQRMLGTHPEIHTVAEPWILLRTLYWIDHTDETAGYEPKIETRAVRGFIESLPGGEEDYLEGLRRMATHLYERSIEGTGKTVFLDKTPRYALILPRLRQLFPQAWIIVLLRNPLAVLTSILETWVPDDPSPLSRFRSDLLETPRNLATFLRGSPERTLTIRFADLVRDPETPLRSICETIGLEFHPGMSVYGESPLPHWEFGDPKEIYAHDRPEPDKADDWTARLDQPQVWQFASDYLQWLGPELITQLGYDWNAMEQTLAVHRPGSIQLLSTLPLEQILGRKPRART